MRRGRRGSGKDDDGPPVFFDREEMMEHLARRRSEELDEELDEEMDEEIDTMASNKLKWMDVTNQKIDRYVKAYESEQGDLLYLEDERMGEQTELSEMYWERGRYQLNLRPGYAPNEPSGLERHIEAFDNLDEAEGFIEGLLTEL